MNMEQLRVQSLVTHTLKEFGNDESQKLQEEVISIFLYASQQHADI